MTERCFVTLVVLCTLSFGVSIRGRLSECHRGDPFSLDTSTAASTYLPLAVVLLLAFDDLYRPAEFFIHTPQSSPR